MASPARLRLVLLAALAVLAALLAAPVPAAQAAPETTAKAGSKAGAETGSKTGSKADSRATAEAAAKATSKERVYGAINCPRLPKCPKMRMQWFDGDWNYLGRQRANGGGYSLRLAPGRYHLQFIDQRPSYDTSKYAPTNVSLRVRQHTVSKNVTMKPGASITGVARAGGKPLRGARLYAANRSEQSFPTTANKKGQFAIGGLPAGKYCVFAYDRAKRWVDKCTWVGGLDFGQSKNRGVTLRKKAGNLTVFLETKAGGRAPNSTATVTSKKTGQWWVTKVRSGKAVFRGLYPGRYRISYNGGGVWFAASGKVHGGSVRPGRMAFGDFTVPKRGGVLVGHILDGGADRMIPLKPPYANAGAKIQLFSASGSLLSTAMTDEEGRFRLQGRLDTQSGLTIVVDPSPDAGGYMNGEGYCQFEHAEYTGYSVRAGQESYIGQLAIPRTPGQENPACASDAPRARAS